MCNVLLCVVVCNLCDEVHTCNCVSVYGIACYWCVIPCDRVMRVIRMMAHMHRCSCVQLVCGDMHTHVILFFWSRVPVFCLSCWALVRSQGAVSRDPPPSVSLLLIAPLFFMRAIRGVPGVVCEVRGDFWEQR